MAKIYNYDDWKTRSGNYEKLERKVATCFSCGEELRACDEFVEWESEYFCDEYCLVESLDYRRVLGEDIE